MPEEIEPRESLRHLSKVQIVKYLKNKEMQRRNRDDAFANMYPGPGEPKTMVTEVHPRRVIGKIRQRMMMAALDLTRERNLLEIFDEAEDEVMIALKRQGRYEQLELKGALSASKEADAK